MRPADKPFSPQALQPDHSAALSSSNDPSSPPKRVKRAYNPDCRFHTNASKSLHKRTPTTQRSASSFLDCHALLQSLSCTEEVPTSSTTSPVPTRRKTALSISALNTEEKVIKTCLLQPYRPKVFCTEQQGIARPSHGVQHACRTATWSVALLQLRKEMSHPDAVDFPDEMIPLLIQACLYHDSGRMNDGADRPEWEQASGNNLAEHLRNSGYSQEVAWQCAEAVRLKDQPELCTHLPAHIQTLRSLLHDADVLDVMRVRSTFYMDRLDCFQRCNNEIEREKVRNLAVEVCRTISRQSDLASDIVLQDSGESTEVFFSTKGHYSDEDRMQWEHDPKPLCRQLLDPERQSQLLNNLLAPYTNGLEDTGTAFSLSRLTLEKGPLGGCSIEGTGKYTDSASGESWYVKAATSRESACNQVLMANLASELGLKVPETFTHEEDGKYFVVSRWLDGLKGGEKTLRAMPRQQWAKLLLINVIVGNEDITNSGWENIEVDSDGNPVMFDWDCAGLATRYQSGENGVNHREDDFASMPVLLKKLRDLDAPVMNSRNLKVASRPLLATLEDDELGAALQDIMNSLDGDRFNRLVEYSGFRAGDRSWLRQTLWDRCAWLSTRLPASRGANKVSEAEYRSVQAAGTRGGWLQVNSTDIPAGQLCVEELLDSNSSPQTRMMLRLSRDASRRLSESLAVEQGLHRLQVQIQYFNNTPIKEYQEWRSDLKSLACECHNLGSTLIRDRDRWLDKDRETVDLMIRQLSAISEHAEDVLQSNAPDKLERFPEIADTLPTPSFPARVTSRLATESEARVQLAEYSHGFTRLTGESATYFDQQLLDQENLSISPVRVFELSTNKSQQGSIQFFAENLPDAQTFENKLVITLPGHSRETLEGLFRELDDLGIKSDRPEVTELENRWLDDLARYHGCLGTMLCAVDEDIGDALPSDKKRLFLADRLNMTPQQLDWESHLRIRSGRLVGYRPGLPHNIGQDPAALYCPSHNLSYAASQRGQAKMVKTMLENEASLSSFERRTDIGVEPFGTDGGLLRQAKLGGAGETFTRIKHRVGVNHDDAAGLLSMQLKPSALGRLDATVFAERASFKSSYGDLEAHRRNKRQLLDRGLDYQRLADGNSVQETLFNMPLSLFDELDTLNIGNPEEQQELLATLKQRYSHWPDGRPVEDIFQQSSRSWFLELTDIHTTIPDGAYLLIKTFGLDNFEWLMKNNPEILQSRLTNLDGVKIGNSGWRDFRELNFSRCSMKGTQLEAGVVLQECVFNTEQLKDAALKNTRFINCTFEGEYFDRQVLDNATFEIRANYRNWAERRHEVEKLSEMFYRSCHQKKSTTLAGDDFDLNLWLDLMIKNKFFGQNEEYLDNTTCEILGNYAQQIRNKYPEKLPKLINARLPIEFGKDIDGAKQFFDNNPFWFKRQISSLDGVCCDGSSHEPNHPERLLKWNNPYVVLSWLTNFPDQEINNRKHEASYSLRGGSAKMKYLRRYYPEKLDTCSRDIVTRACAFADKFRLMNPAVYTALTHLASNRLLTSEEESFWLQALTRTVTEANLLFPSYKAWWDYRAHFQDFWQVCRSTEKKLECARSLIERGDTIVKYSTTIMAFEYLADHNLGEECLEHFIENLTRHLNEEYMNNHDGELQGYDKLRKRLKEMEKTFKTNHPKLFELWQQHNFIKRIVP